MIKNEAKIIKSLSIAICSIPALLITGPFLSDLVVSFVSLFFLILSFKFYPKFKKYYNNFYFKYFIVFYLFLILSSIFSDFTIFSLKNSLFYFRFGIFSLCVWYVLDNNSKFLKYFYYSLLFPFLILISDSIYQYLTGFNILGYPFQKPRLSSFFGDELILGSYFSRLYPLLFGTTIFCINNKLISKKNLFLLALIFVFLDLLIFLSGERVAFAYLNISLILFLFLASNYKIFRLFIYIVSIILIFIVSTLDRSNFDRLYTQSVNEIQLKSENKYIFSRAHNEIYASSLKMFEDNLVIGVGPKNYRKVCNNPKYFAKREYFINSSLDRVEYVNACNTHSHNTYIQLLAETGIIGFLFVILIFILCCKRLFEHFYFRIFKKKSIFSDFQICLFISVVISLFPFLPTGSFFNNWINIVYFLPIGFLLWTFEKKQFCE
jgi:O-antigen ligase